MMLTASEALAIEERADAGLGDPAYMLNVWNEMDDPSKAADALARLFSERTAINDHGLAQHDARQAFLDVARKMETRIYLAERRQDDINRQDRDEDVRRVDLDFCAAHGPMHYAGLDRGLDRMKP